jgi:predicted negative regulator of RcsB-dependent stress response
MPRRKIREELKRKDFFLSAFEKVKSWTRENARTCMIGALVVVLLALSGWAFVAYKTGKNERAQHQLATGISKFLEFTLANKTDALPKAETDFKEVARISSDGLKDAAELYLARIALAKGNKQEAKVIYSRVAQKPSNDVVKKLAETGLSNLTKE